ncbi:uncharacterized protein B0H18DRAFT_37759 [Fomitopsis serialis]|uniref:uncharacterized protein n=1 Tax=Fomitopsis serialis TaxID=139415 RepID=UPI0020088FB2|nr:uncharacterized protein B0H18DRAFT_37759 [Neoantrodia serialis]KAH9917292.1 hypothetical protein B0H18DRAFT_37759 [Neoantrodia serialis]
MSLHLSYKRRPDSQLWPRSSVWKANLGEYSLQGHPSSCAIGLISRTCKEAICYELHGRRNSHWATISRFAPAAACKMKHTYDCREGEYVQHAVLCAVSLNSARSRLKCAQAEPMYAPDVTSGELGFAPNRGWTGVDRGVMLMSSMVEEGLQLRPMAPSPVAPSVRVGSPAGPGNFRGTWTDAPVRGLPFAAHPSSFQPPRIRTDRCARARPSCAGTNPCPGVQAGAPHLLHLPALPVRDHAAPVSEPPGFTRTGTGCKHQQ